MITCTVTYKDRKTCVLAGYISVRETRKKSKPPTEKPSLYTQEQSYC